MPREGRPEGLPRGARPGSRDAGHAQRLAVRTATVSTRSPFATMSRSAPVNGL